MKIIQIKITLLLLFFVTQVFGQVSHQAWDELLKKHVSKEGKVNYKGFIQNTRKLDAYLSQISENPPKKSWTEAQKLAYWINAYNAFTIKLIINNYPINSIQDLHPTIKIPGISTIWHKEFFKIGGVDENLNDIEHKVLRKEFDEPRIHFAINCASVSCPNLRNEAYSSKKLELQLEDQAKKFVNDYSKNKLEKDRVQLSKLFSWFKKDFTKNTSLIAFLNKYAKQKIDESADVDYLDYDWSLNE